jgi:hypothetical protein
LEIAVECSDVGNERAFTGKKLWKGIGPNTLIEEGVGIKVRGIDVTDFLLFVGGL